MENKSGNVEITNREIYDNLMKMKGQITTLWTTHTLSLAVVTYLILEGLKK